MIHSHQRFLFLIIITLVFGCGLLIWHFQTADAQTKPLTYPEIITALNSKLPNKSFKNKTQVIDWLITQIKQNKIDKSLTADREDVLRQAGATDQLIEAIRKNSPSGSIPVVNPTPLRNPTVLDDSNTLRNSLGMEFVRISSGSFMMGSEIGDLNEKPIHQVIISNNFWLGTTEVTQGQWKAIMGNNPSSFNNCGDNCPVENISWVDVQNFIKKLNSRGEGIYRLPTEAEWEYAARAGSNTKYSNGNDESVLEMFAWYDANSENKTHQVATRKPNNWGLYDMLGNVWEWCEDRNGNYTSDNVIDPKGGNSSSYRVERGGSWYNRAGSLYLTIRGGSKPEDHNETLGFRLLRQ